MSVRRRSWMAVLGAATLVVAAYVPPAAAAAPRERESTVPTAVILDASGSMLESDAPGPRIDAAKAAATRLIDDLPADARVGLLVYGTGTGSDDSEKDAGCRDVQTLIPVGDVDKAAMTSAIAGIQASGYTPIGLALRQAADALPDGEGAVVLVSDGIDTCAPPEPCEVAKELVAAGIDLTVHTVGFRVDEAARAQLACIADATGGTYADAQDAGQLSDALRVKVDYAVTGYDVKGTPVTGALGEDGDLPRLAPGQWLDSFDAADLTAGHPGDAGSEVSSRFYRLDVPEGHRAHVTASLVLPSLVAPDPDHYTAVTVTVDDAAGAECATRRDVVTSVSETLMPPTAAVSADCDGPLTVELRRDGTMLLDSDLAVEILVRLEPPADARGLPSPERRPGPAAPVPDPAAAVDLDGGSSFNSAVDIVAGQTYRSRIGTGEAKFFKVRLDWGQQLSYTIAHDRRLDGGDRMNVVNPRLSSPLRALVTPAEDPYRNLVWRTESDPSSRSIGRSTPEPVRYGSEEYGLPGFYYITLADQSSDGDFVLDSFLLTVTVAGDREDGPRYELADGETAEATGAPEAAAPAPAGGPGWGTIAVVAAGAVVIAAGAVGALVLVRRRRGA